MKWKKHYGYQEEHHYIDANGRIVGVVYGSAFHPDSGWTANTEKGGKNTTLGRYTDLDSAKKAVEKSVSDWRKKRFVKRPWVAR